MEDIPAMEMENRKKSRASVSEWKKEMIKDKSMSRVFKAKMNELSEDIWEEQSFIDKRHKDKVGKIAPRWYLDWSIEAAKKRLKNLEGLYRKFEYYHRLSLGKVEEKGMIDIERVKVEVLIGDLIPGQLRKEWGGRVKYKCPLHEEKTPSFVWYVKSNRFHCFGCSEGGSVIDLFMKLNGVDFRETIIQLDNY